MGLAIAPEARSSNIVLSILSLLVLVVLLVAVVLVSRAMNDECRCERCIELLRGKVDECEE
jgi:hypothetical protein